MDKTLQEKVIEYLLEDNKRLKWELKHNQAAIQTETVSISSKRKDVCLGEILLLVPPKNKVAIVMKTKDHGNVVDSVVFLGLPKDCPSEYLLKSICEVRKGIELTITFED